LSAPAAVKTGGVPPRSLWTGSISFGLVNVPARLYSAVSEHTLHFHFVHEKDDSRIGYEKICKEEGKPVPNDEIVKAFEYEKGEFVYMTDEDFAAARVEGYKTIDIHEFVPYDEIDPIYFRHTYYVGPQEGAEKVYALLVEAMEESGLAGITKFIMRDRQNLGCIRVRDGVLTLEQMYFADEVRPLDDVRPARTKVEKRELEMALQLIDSFSGSFDPTQYKDTYREALCDVIEAKRKGKKVHVAADHEEEAPPDLMEALRQSINSAKKTGSRNGGGHRARGRQSRTKSASDLQEKTKAELLKLARRAEIDGRSQMNKDELVDALESS
jgi:DNA end-binding protein Ku